jgi:nicotinamidase/pyrazinamidase
VDTLSRRKFLGAAGALTAAASLGRFGDALAAGAVKPTESDALLVIDMQNCFVPGGTLPVKEGDTIAPLINRIAKSFQNVVLTQDWHTKDHVSFASQHAGKKPFEMIALFYGNQVLWPDHCVQGTKDAEIVSGIDIPQAQLIIRKGYHSNVDSYSAFLEADRKTETGLAGYLKGRKINQVFVCGLATDYCVAWSALDARRFGFAASVIEDACRGIDLNGSIAAAWKDMTQAGVKRIQSGDIQTA